MVLEQVAFDIETTGFAATDEVTVVGFAVPVGVRLFVQTSGRSGDDVSPAVAAVTPGETLVNVSTHLSEHELLAAVSAFAAERLAGEDVLLVAYNGERWNGGFDVPFLRTRYAQQELQWPFADVPYADLMPIVADRFNTTVTGDDDADGDDDDDAAGTRERNDLGHASLCCATKGTVMWTRSRRVRRQWRRSKTAGSRNSRSITWRMCCGRKRSAVSRNSTAQNRSST